MCCNFNPLTVTDRPQEWSQMDACLRVHCKRSLTQLVKQSTGPGAILDLVQGNEIGEMNTVTGKLINP